MSQFLAVIKSLLASFTSILPVLAAFGTTVDPKLAVAAPVALTLIGAVEEGITQAGSGPIKNQVVVDTFQTFVNGMAAVSTGGQAETYQKINGIGVKPLVDSLVGVVNNLAKAVGKDPVIDVATFEATKTL